MAVATENFNQSVPFEDVDLLGLDPALQEALEREGAGWAFERVREAGLVAGSAEAQAHGRRAERNEPRLITHDRFGHRVDQVELDPSWHWLLDGAVSRGIHALPWADPRPGAHVARAALEFLWTHANSGVMCPISMTYSAVPALRVDPEIASEWEPRLIAGALCGLAMTEQQGGSDVRANTTRAEPVGDGWFELHLVDPVPVAIVGDQPRLVALRAPRVRLGLGRARHQTGLADALDRPRGTLAVQGLTQRRIAREQVDVFKRNRLVEDPCARLDGHAVKTSWARSSGS